MAANEESLFLAARERATPHERRAFLEEACGTDAALRERLLRLVAADEKASGILERGVLPLADAEAGAAAPAAPGEPSAHPADSGRPGEVLEAKYKLLVPIGEGGMGAAWMAQQTAPVKRLVAVKLIKAGMDSRSVLARFEAERQALALMDHPNIARVLDAGTTGAGRPYFVMDLVKGVPITAYCDEHRLTPRQRLGLFVDVCRAVQHAHQKGVIHRDLKPSNVLVALYDGKPVPKVIDFGVAKAAGPALTEKTLVTGFGALVGTLEYMSPEQAEFNQLDIDTRSDVYSLGVLLYELLTGTPPFSRKELEKVGMLEMLRVIREQDPTRPSTKLSTAEGLPTLAANRGTEPAKLARLVRGELDWIVMKALEKDRNRRYETANGLALDVQRYLADEPVLACPPSAGYRLRKFARRNRARLAVAGGLFLAVTVTAATIGWAVGDRAARRATVAVAVRDSLNIARALILENELAVARQKLAEARAQLGHDRPALGDLAAEVEAVEADLDRFQQFLALIDRAHQAEAAPVREPALAAEGSRGNPAGTGPVRTLGRRSAEAVPFFLKALQCYGVLERDDWTSTLEGGPLGGQQVEQVRRLAYEVLLWLADDVLRRRQGHPSEQSHSTETAARQALVYLGQAERAHRATQALYTLRTRCRKALGEEAAAQADTQRAAQAPATMALDHYLRGQDAYDAKQLAAGVQAFEAALRLEPTHYWSLMKLGYCLCDLGRGPDDFIRAATVFTGCILKRPDHGHAYCCRGHAYSNLDHYEEAVADYCRALELDPQNADTWYSRGRAYLKGGRPDKALPDLSKAVELNPTHAPAWANRGVAYNKLGQPDKAVADYSRAIGLDPTDASFWNARGVSYTRLGQPGKALADCSKALELDPKCVSAWANRGVAQDRLGQPKQAVADYSRALELDPTHALAWANRGAAYNALGQPDKAVADCSRAIKLNPKLALAWYNRAVAYNKLDQPAKALADCSRAVELDPTGADPWHTRGVAYTRLGQPDKAVAAYSRALELDPKLARTWNARGAAYRKLGRPDKAVAAYSRALELDPKLASAWNSRAAAYARLGQSDKASADFAKVIELNPHDGSAWHSRGLAYLNLGQPAKAVADFSKALELDPKLARTWNARGAAYRKLGRPDKAVADYSRALELDSKLALAWYNRALAYAKLGQLDKALSDCSRALELDPKLADAWFTRGVLYTRLGQPDKALADCAKAIELAPNAPQLVQAYLGRAYAHGRLAHFEQARADYQTFLGRAPDHAEGHDALAWLLATCPDPKVRDPARAVELAQRAVLLAPREGAYRRTQGVAHYRAGDWQRAVAVLDLSRELRQGGDAVDRFFLAMAHRKLGNHDEARQAYEQALQWLEKNREALDQDQGRAEELRRFRAEAEEVLELKK
jgi:tetratricopeptide (TPR) repeat protein